MYSFDNFDPLDGEVPGYPFFELPHIAWEARKFLEGLSRDEVIAIEEVVADTVLLMQQLYVAAGINDYAHRVIEEKSWELEYHPKSVPVTPDSVVRLLKNWPADAERKPELETEEDLSEIEAIRFAVEVAGSSKLHSEIKDHPARCVAVLALMFVSGCIQTLECPEEELGVDEQGPVVARLVAAANEAIEAARALGLAKEIFATVALLEVQEKQSPELLMKLFSQDRARKAAEKRHGPMAEAKKFVQEKWAAEAEGYKFNKTDFARTCVDMVRENFRDTKGDPLRVTIKTITDSWLGNSLSASKMAR